MRLLITGGTGFLGRHVVRHAIAQGHEPTVLVRPSRASWALSQGLPVTPGDLRNRNSLDDALDGAEAVIHLAACVVGDDDTQFQNTVVGTENLLAAMDSAGVERMVHCSSFSVYDWSAARGRLDESTPLERAKLYRRDGYAVAKAWQERIVRRWGEQTDRRLTVLRPGFIWGRGNERIAAIGQQAGPLDVVVGPLRELPITYVENCAEAFVLALETPAAAGATLNVIDDERVSAWRYASHARTRLGLRKLPAPLPYWVLVGAAHSATLVSRMLFRSGGKLPGLLMPNRVRARFAPLRFPNDAIKQTLGWTPRWDFEEAWDRCVSPDHADQQVAPGATPPAAPTAAGPPRPVPPGRAGELSHA